ncbi:hypothetical protein CEXT_753071 [Caerostris extrusa]|uniref:IGFBP N-terminal domain-containing protein n=1 Tax=Caerostris extrusa TaxID=172846 RepID=A0AAV4XME0_CAEEX|nr:hypothetical protein CEXT_753071 [Caerostris extrusa]
MKNLVALFALVALISVLVIKVECTSPRNCDAGCQTCVEEDCQCGSYMDQCDCCPICMKCAGETCLTVRGDRCEDGYTCGDPNRSLLEMINSPATCIEEED